MYLHRSLAFTLPLFFTGCGQHDAGQDTDGDDCLDGCPGTGPDSGDPPGEGIPCEVAHVLSHHCLGCHGSPPVYGAPMALENQVDFHARAVSDPDRKVYELVAERVTDDARPMPPNGGLSAVDLALLVDWVHGGAKAYDGPACPGEDHDDPGPIGPEALPCTPSHTFVAHGGDGQQAFRVPTVGADNLYQCFTFRSPFTADARATAWAPIVDDERVLHHWILYRTATAQPDNGVMPCQMPQDAVFVAGWAPGGGNFVLPDDIGLELAGPDDWFILQVHYHNTAHHPDALDRSGVALCTTDTPRPKTAGILTLGTINLTIPNETTDFTVSGLCPSWATSLLPQPVNAIASFPHMHELGRALRTEILRGGDAGPADILVDVPQFSFESQLFYPHVPPKSISPGDAIRTTCTYDNPTAHTVHFGEKTEDEMCFNFVMVEPIELLGDNRSCGLL